jgi:dGTPase
MNYNYAGLLKPIRKRQTTVINRESIEEFYSDRSRIVFSSSFRRLQQKAQVFSLESNSSVRTRLTHSIEVSDIGRTLASKIANRLVAEKFIESNLASQIVAVVENACLLHDIGNPPFGHFGESAIQEWSKKRLKRISRRLKLDSNSIDKYLKDFFEFDGNPQGIRTILRLHCEKDQNGLNLTYPSILSCIKYTRCTGAKKDSINKKGGYFITEKEILRDIYNQMNLNPKLRYPLAYIMEAADDISYCLSDISDGIEKKIISIMDFVIGFKKIWVEKYPKEDNPLLILNKEDIQYFNIDISVPISTKIINEAVENYINNHEAFFTGKSNGLIDKNKGGRILEVMKIFSKQKLYRSPEAENIELSGYSVITGLLNHFSELLIMKKEDFLYFVENNQCPPKKIFDLQWRLFNKLSRRCIKVYRYQLSQFKDNPEIEWWLRIHLIIDYISGMTDDYALEMYQMLEGIKINYS